MGFNEQELSVAGHLFLFERIDQIDGGEDLTRLAATDPVYGSSHFFEDPALRYLQSCLPTHNNRLVLAQISFSLAKYLSFSIDIFTGTGSAVA